jgi:hypothetical protein
MRNFGKMYFRSVISTNFAKFGAKFAIILTTQKKPLSPMCLLALAFRVDIEMQRMNQPNFGIHIFEGHVESTLETFSLRSTRVSKC